MRVPLSLLEHNSISKRTSSWATMFPPPGTEYYQYASCKRCLFPCPAFLSHLISFFHYLSFFSPRCPPPHGPLCYPPSLGGNMTDTLLTAAGAVLMQASTKARSSIPRGAPHRRLTSSEMQADSNGINKKNPVPTAQNNSQLYPQPSFYLTLFCIPNP